MAALNDPRVTLICGDNLGFGRSFLTLLAQAPPDADMVMFSDQDDVWLPDKVERAWRHLRALDGQAGLYGGAQVLVDATCDRCIRRRPGPAGLRWPTR